VFVDYLGVAALVEVVGFVIYSEFAVEDDFVALAVSANFEAAQRCARGRTDTSSKHEIPRKGNP